jgi:2-C-methyl-D-erythritol 4-phosphate cytidylyltransferase
VSGASQEPGARRGGGRPVPRDPRVAVIVPAAGSGDRLGAGTPKALVDLGGAPILAHAIRSLLAEPRVGVVVVAAPPGLEAQVRETAGEAAAEVPVVVVTGGATRAASVRNALGAVPAGFEVVLVHDAARCLVPAQVVGAVIDAVVAGARAVVPGVPVVDTIRELVGEGGSRTIDRSALRAVQTPQGFPIGLLRQAHDVGDSHATDDAGMVEALGHPVEIVPGHPRAFKVTTAWDLRVARTLLAEGAGE